MSSYPDNQMQSVLDHIRRYSSSTSNNNTESNTDPYQRSKSPMVASAISRRQSNDILMNDVAARRLSEAGVNRRPSAALVLTEDTDSFRIGDRVYVDGIKPGRIQFIGKNFLKEESPHCWVFAHCLSLIRCENSTFLETRIGQNTNNPL